jgi:hypothetical protein
MDNCTNHNPVKKRQSYPQGGKSESTFQVSNTDRTQCWLSTRKSRMGVGGWISFMSSGPNVVGQIAVCFIRLLTLSLWYWGCVLASRGLVAFASLLRASSGCEVQIVVEDSVQLKGVEDSGWLVFRSFQPPLFPSPGLFALPIHGSITSSVFMQVHFVWVEPNNSWC